MIGLCQRTKTQCKQEPGGILSSFPTSQTRIASFFWNHKVQILPIALPSYLARLEMRNPLADSGDDWNTAFDWVCCRKTLCSQLLTLQCSVPVISADC